MVAGSPKKPNRELPWWKKLGPGLITGAADDDPSGIATYSQGGAQFGYSLLWTLFFTYPLMVGIQVVSARIGRVSGYGLAGNIRRHYSPAILYSLVSLLLIANTINGNDADGLQSKNHGRVHGDAATEHIGLGGNSGNGCSSSSDVSSDGPLVRNEESPGRLFGLAFRFTAQSGQPVR